jgi:hypothetical protein
LYRCGLSARPGIPGTAIAGYMSIGDQEAGKRWAIVKTTYEVGARLYKSVEVPKSEFVFRSSRVSELDAVYGPKASEFVTGKSSSARLRAQKPKGEGV